jgi:hypothetical protein
LNSSISAISESICGVIVSETVLMGISIFIPINIHKGNCIRKSTHKYPYLLAHRRGGHKPPRRWQSDGKGIGLGPSKRTGREIAGQVIG